MEISFAFQLRAEHHSVGCQILDRVVTHQHMDSFFCAQQEFQYDHGAEPSLDHSLVVAYISHLVVEPEHMMIKMACHVSCQLF